jgi:hypothetical protein
MHKKIILVACGIFIVIAGSAQMVTPAVIASAGEVSKTSVLYLQWTLGEPAIETISSKSQLFTQGFHQPLLMVKRAAIVVPQKEKLEVLIMPNPVEHICRAVITKQNKSTVYLDLADIHGRKLYSTVSHQKVDIVDINFSTYASGTYVLTVRDVKGNLFQTVKIIKAH